uniref:Uncharacterized protein n=1 Tax=Panagrolaimus sp. ES5 TaxID=591445 RepID=A0AC34F540_9BILA
MALILMGYVLVKEEPNQDIVHVYDILFIASFWSGMISYVSLSVLKLFAVARPFHYRARKFVHTFHKNRHSTTVKPKFLQFPLWKLAINVATFAFFNSFYIIRIVAILIYGNSDKCFWQNNKPLMMETLGIVRLFLLARIIVDPIISFIMDYQIKKSILNMFGIHGRVEPSDSSRPFRKETSSSDCQSRIKTSTTIFENELSAQSKNNTDMNL